MADIEFRELRTDHAGKSFAGVVIMRNGDADDPFASLPQEIEVSSEMVFRDHSYFRVDEYGLLHIDWGVINGWAKYRMDSYKPTNDAFFYQLREGYIEHPKKSLNRLLGDVEDE